MTFDAAQRNYISFRDLASEGTSRVVAWVGAGLSRSAGLPSWTELLNALKDSLRTNAATLEEPDRARVNGKLNNIDRQPDPWVAFQILEEALGPATFRDTIREQLKQTPKAATPSSYLHLWKLPISGLLNLNLDRIATRAYAEAGFSAPVNEFSGFQVKEVAHLLKSPRPFIFNLHGVAEDSSSWVLTNRSLTALTSAPGYQEFINACLLSRTLLFVGISVDDLAVGGHLDRLKQHVSDFGSHFWITHRRDEATNRWAEDHNVRIIRYSSNGEDHSELEELFRCLRNFVPKDDVPPPVVLESDSIVLPITADLSPADLLRESAETIREVLNVKAKAILDCFDSDRLEKFNGFCRTFDEAIYRAWYTTDGSSHNNLFGYELRKRVAKGAFGTVFSARDKNKNQVAVKVLNEELRTNSQMLESFRRGVRSMRILSDRGVDGMVPYIDATEIPAIVVMDWVEGPNLKDAMEAGFLDDWNVRLRVVTSLAQIILRAHSLPERVLHRDIRPPNIMLQGYYQDPANFKIMVLDFDLSWHLGATEKSVLLGSATGYLAPEQLQLIQGVSTRHAAVDAFGLGMCLFFIVSGRDPLPFEQAHANWHDTVMRSCRRKPCGEWASLRERYGRAILNSTRDRQSERWDMGQLSAELERLKICLEAPDKVLSAELLAEEVVARSRYAKQYEWVENDLSARLSLPSGIQLSMTGDEARTRLTFHIRWSSGGDLLRRNVIKWLPEAGRKIADLLRSNSWTIEGGSSWGEQIEFSASQDVDLVRKNLEQIPRMLERASETLRFK